MPDKANHIKRAKLNETFAVDIATIDKKYKYWIITAYHYSALHWIDAYLANIPYHPHDHRTRNNWIVKDSRLKNDIYKDYCDLKYLCNNARYELISIGPSQLRESKKYHDAIKNHIQKLI